MFDRFKKKKEKSTTTTLTPITKVQEKSVIEKLLNAELSGKELYEILNKDGAGKLDFTSYGGAGKEFKQLPRHRHIEEAFSINDNDKTVAIKSNEWLVGLADSFYRGDIYGISKNINKHVICLAILANQVKDTKVRLEALNKLETLYTDPEFMKHKHRESILTLVKQKKSLLLPKKTNTSIIETAKIEPTNIIIANTTNTTVAAETQISEPEKKITVVETKKEIEILPDIKPDIKTDIKPDIKTEIKPSESNLINENKPYLDVANAIRKILFDNIDTWIAKTSVTLFFFGGVKIQDPRNPLKKVTVPDGIGLMINKLVAIPVIFNDITDVDIAKKVIGITCKIGALRHDMGSRHDCRAGEVNDLYATLSSAVNINVLTKEATIDGSKISSELASTISRIIAKDEVKSLHTNTK